MKVGFGKLINHHRLTNTNLLSMILHKIRIKKFALRQKKQVNISLRKTLLSPLLVHLVLKSMRLKLNKLRLWCQGSLGIDKKKYAILMYLLRNKLGYPELALTIKMLRDLGTNNISIKLKSAQE
jgi:hypothetical protein